MTTIVIRASESAHWYAQDGSPAYTVLAKNGSPRPTTLRDARGRGYVPSVTTVMQCAAKPALEAWKQKQMLLAALTLPKISQETEQQFIDRIVLDSKETGKQAAARGTAVHEAIERSFTEEAGHSPTIEAFHRSVKEHFGDHKWAVETSFCSPLGYGGKLDLHTSGIVLDTKTKEFGPGDVVDGYDEHAMQLAAYRMGLEMPAARCANVFVSVSHPGLICVKEWTEEELQRGWNMFRSLLAYWQFKSKYMIGESK